MCRRDLVAGTPGAESNLSEMAHIRGAASGSPRHDPSISSDKANKHHNLILLCGTCHKIVDDDPSTYTAAQLEEMKSGHEEWGRRRLVMGSKATSFAELEVIAKWMATAPSSGPEEDYSVTPPLKKIKKNGLSDETRMWIEIGMSKSHLVGRYLEAQPDPAFGERLKEGFRLIYRKLRSGEDLGADDVFFRMLAMGEDVKGEGVQTPAVLAVLVYLFEKCEVFEK